MLKSVTSILLTITMLLGMVNTVSADEQNTLLYAEDFQSFAENETVLPSLLMVSGVDSRVIDENGNKVFYSRALGEAINFSFSLPESGASETVMTMKVKLSGEKTDGKLFTATFSGKKANFLNLDEDGTLRLYDNTIIGGLQNTYKTITILANWKRGTFCVYLDKKCVAYDWVLPAASSVAPVNLAFAIESSIRGESEFFVDDIYVYDGNTLPWERTFPKSEQNTEVLDFTPASDIALSEADIIRDFNYESSSTGFTLGKLTNEVSVVTMEDGSMALRWYSSKNTESNGYADITISEMATKSKFVFDFMVKAEKMSGSSKLGFIDTKDTSGAFTVRGFQLNSSAKLKATSGGGTVNFPLNRWVRLSFMYDLKKGKIYIFFDGEQVSENTTVAGTAINTWRFDVKSPQGSELDVYFDWFRVYGGDKLLDEEYFQPNTKADVKIEEEAEGDLLAHSVMTDPEMIKNAFSGKTVFLQINNSLYYEGKKEIITDEAEKLKNINGTLMIPETVFEKINGGKQISYDKASGVISFGDKNVNDIMPLEENGVLYLPLRASAEKLMGKKVSWDERGMAIIADTEVPVRDRVVYTKKHYLFDDYDVMYRYLLFDNPTGKQMLSDLIKNFPNKTHPRVYWTSEDIKYMVSKIETDPLWQEEWEQTKDYADNILYNDLSFTTEFTKRKASGQFKKRITALATAHLISGDIRYAKKGVEMLKGFAAWDDCTGSQLIMGDWAEGMGIGFDAFYNYMKSTENGEKDIEYIKSKMVKVLFPSHIMSYSKGRAYGHSWITLQDNFNGYIGGGMMCMLLAICDEEDIRKESEYLLENVLQSLYVSANLFWPDGGYYEGVTYADMEFENLMNGLDALFNCCGSDYGIGRAPGFTKTGDYFTYLNTPSGEKINFHDDGGGNYYNRFVPEYMGFRYGELYEAQAGHISKNLAQLKFIINYGLKGLYYYDKALTDKGISVDVSDLPLDYYSYAIDTGTFRNTHTDKEPTYVGYHAGWTNVAHDMLDLGEFVFISDGIPWARDLGNDSYDLPAYFSKDGYKIYRKKTEGENCLVLNPQVKPDKYYGQTIGTRATVCTLDINKPRGAFSAFDLTDAYTRDAEKYIRGYYFGDDRNTLIVQDEVTLKGETEMYWFMHTPAEIEIVSENRAILKKDGKTLTVDVYCSVPGFELKEMKAEPLPTSPYIEGQNKNEGYRKLALHHPKVSGGDVVISVKLSPNNGKYEYTPLQYVPISQWTVPEGDAPTLPYFTGIYADGEMLSKFAPGIEEYNIELPYGTNSAPFITALGVGGEIKISQAETPNSKAVLEILNGEGRNIKCTLNFSVSNDRPVNIKRAIKQLSPTAGEWHGESIESVCSALNTNTADASLLKITDQNTDTAFVSDKANTWIEFDMGTLTDISGVSMYFTGSAPSAYQLMYSEDGTNFYMVYDGISQVINGWETLKTPIKARYVRFVAMGDTMASQILTLAEFKILRQEVR